MRIERLIDDLPEMSAKKLQAFLGSAQRALARDASDENARRLFDAISCELRKRMPKRRSRVGALWWEPHDPYVPVFHAYESESSQVVVASIFKNATHTSTRKDVYSVRVGDREISGLFSKVEQAREAGSQAWAQDANTIGDD